MTLDHGEITKTLEIICTNYKKKGSSLIQIQKAHSVLALACTYKLAGKISQIIGYNLYLGMTLRIRRLTKYVVDPDQHTLNSSETSDAIHRKWVNR